MKVIAIVGMTGAGKSEVARVFEEHGFKKVRFGDITDDELNNRGLEPNEENERRIRGELRKKYGMAAYAKLSLPRVDTSLKSSNVVIDGLYSWEEYTLLRERYGERLRVLAVWSSPATRHARLGHRAKRPLTLEEALLGAEVPVPTPTGSVLPTFGTPEPTLTVIPEPTITTTPGVEEQIFKVLSIGAAYNGATTPTTFSISQSWLVTYILTYHWNNGQGVTPGTIGLRASDGTVYGPWQATGEPGQGGVPDANWIVRPNAVIPPGTYTVVDSDPSTWAQNDETGGAGMSWANGIRQ